MMKIISFILLIVIMILFFRVIDASLEIDDLKSVIRLQSNDIIFLQSVTNNALVSCEITLDKFDKIAEANGYTIRWDNQEQTGFGFFTATRDNSCVLKIEHRK